MMAGTGSMPRSEIWLLAQHMLKIGAVSVPPVFSYGHIFSRQLGHDAFVPRKDVIVHRKSVGCERGAARTEQRALQLRWLVLPAELRHLQLSQHQ